ncbi:MAG: TIGR01777 family oxidoreductase [Ferruginibacter sp.]
MKKIVIAGGTGFIGKYISKQFRSEGYEVIIISRQPEHTNWDDMDGMVSSLNNAEMLINLAGKSVNCRYNKRNKEEILYSRTRTTNLLGEAILKCKVPPKLWVNSGTATIYRHAEDRPMTETNGEIGKGFSVDVAQSWEKAFFTFDLPNTRQIVFRMAIVLGKEGGVMKPLVNLTKTGLGGKQGKGTQKFSWIHLEDLYSAIKFVKEHTNLSGVFNLSSPNPVTNEALMSTLRKTLHISIGLPASEWLLKIGAVLIGTETELILKSRWVIPENLINGGFKFIYPDLEPAIVQILNK